MERLQVLVDELVAARGRTDALERDLVQLREITNSLLKERNRLLRETARQDSLLLQRAAPEVLEGTPPDSARSESRW